MRHTHTTKRCPEEFELESPVVVTASNGVEMELTAFGVRFRDDEGELHHEVRAFRVTLRGEERSADVWLDEECYETPQTFSELEAFPEHHGGPLEAAWNEVCDGNTATALAFDDALTALEREFDN